MEFYHYLLIWAIIGALISLIRIFLFYRGPYHMIQMYFLSESKAFASEAMKILLTFNKKLWKFVLFRTIGSMILMPFALIELLVEVYLFTFVFDVSNKTLDIQIIPETNPNLEKKDENEQPRN